MNTETRTVNKARTLRVAVIGAGNMGFHHARVYAQLDRVKLCAVSDIDPVRAHNVATRFGAVPYTDYGAMLGQEELDAVTIAVPTRAHLRTALDVIKHGKHLLVEKPLAADVLEAEQIVAAARSANVHLIVGHVERFNPAVQELRRRIAEGMLGEVTSVVAKRVGVMPPQVKDANVIIDLAVHDLDILNFFFHSLPDQVTATAGHALLSNRFDHAEIFLKYAHTGCFVQVNWITPLKIRTLSVTGNGGHAELNYVTQKLEIFESTHAREYDDFGDFVIRFGEARRTVVEIEMREPLRAELENFMGVIRNEADQIVTGQDGVNALQVAGRILENLNRG